MSNYKLQKLRQKVQFCLRNTVANIFSKQPVHVKIQFLCIQLLCIDAMVPSGPMTPMLKGK